MGYLYRLSVPRHMEWELVRRIRDLPVCSPTDLSMPPWSEEMIGLLPGYAQHGYPAGEVLKLSRPSDVVFQSWVLITLNEAEQKAGFLRPATLGGRA